MRYRFVHHGYLVRSNANLYMRVCVLMLCAVSRSSRRQNALTALCPAGANRTASATPRHGKSLSLSAKTLFRRSLGASIQSHSPDPEAVATLL